MVSYLQEERLYAQLRSLARSRSHGARSTLQPTALANEAWIKLHPTGEHYVDETHFLAVARRAMRQVVLNHAREARTRKRTPPGKRVTMEGLTEHVEEPDALRLDELLRKLARLNRRHARVVELRFFCALTIEETALLLNVSTGTVERDWKLARAWLRRELSG